MELIDTSKSEVEALNQFGEEGWELVTIRQSKLFAPEFFVLRRSKTIPPVTGPHRDW